MVSIIGTPTKTFGHSNMKTIPKTFEQFKSVMSYEFAGIDPEHDMHYWKLWLNSNLDWEDFLTAIRTGKI